MSGGKKRNSERKPKPRVHPRCTLCDNSGLWCGECQGDLDQETCNCPETPECPQCESFSEADLNEAEKFEIEIDSDDMTWAELVRCAGDDRDRMRDYVLERMTDWDPYEEKRKRMLPEAFKLKRKRAMETVDKYLDRLQTS